MLVQTAGGRHRRLLRLAPLLAAGAALLGSAATYRDWLDGPPERFYGALALGVAGLLVAAGAAGHQPPWLLGLVGALSVLPLPVVHAVRGAGRATPLTVEVHDFFDYGRLLDPSVTGSATVRPGSSELIVSTPSGSVGYVELKLPADSALPWTRPRLLGFSADPRVGEALTWTAAVERERVYFGLVDVDKVVAETTSWGVQVTDAAGRGERVTYPVGLPMPAAGDQTWTVRRERGRLTLLAGELAAWSTADRGPFKVVRIGETRTDGEHGGVLRLHAVRYARYRV